MVVLPRDIDGKLYSDSAAGRRSCPPSRAAQQKVLGVGVYGGRFQEHP